MQLSDENIKLSPLNKQDFEFYLEITTCSDIMEHISETFTQTQAMEAFETRVKPWSIESDGWCTLPITEIQSDTKIGWVSFRVVDHTAKTVEVGFILKENAQRKGIVSRALTLVKAYLFDELNQNKLVAFCSVGNVASYSVLEKNGFIREGCFIEHFFIKNRHVDSYAYGLCKSSYSKQSS